MPAPDWMNFVAQCIGWAVILAAVGGVGFGLLCLSAYGWSIILRKAGL